MGFPKAALLQAVLYELEHESSEYAACLESFSNNFVIGLFRFIQYQELQRQHD